MKMIALIFRKELKDMLRDRRTLFFMILMPFLIIFLIVNLTMRLGMDMEKRAQEKELKVAVFSAVPLPAFVNLLQTMEKVKIDTRLPRSEINQAVNDSRLDFAISFPDDFSEKNDLKETNEVAVYYKASTSENERALGRIQKVLEAYGKQLLNLRLEKKNLTAAFVEPIKIIEMDISSIREKMGQRVGGMLPYLLVIFCFLGAMYPAIDLAAGEKERGTMETLLVSPATRLQIVVGKFLVVTASGIFTALTSVLWLYLVFRQSKMIPPEILSVVLKLIEWKSLLLFFSMIIPLCAFFAAILLSVSVFAKSYKEASSIIAPLNMIIIIPVLIGIFPGIKLSSTTALIPILNISLATKEIIAGTISSWLMAEVFLVLFALAAVGLIFCTRWFNREAIIFRGV
ncbi:MAG: ABC transporter permease subunit [Candidatus Aminicenantes bacterium]|nr:ABC transporter permease subunit [Acidobacteriota bacterium]MCG2812111.1 ABC transporter permease subunit [Candidatus Aminicenantes bacterium]